jgi:hypothetical protein
MMMSISAMAKSALDVRSELRSFSRLPKQGLFLNSNLQFKPKLTENSKTMSNVLSV